MTTNIDYIKTEFEYSELTKIVGRPSYQSLKKIFDECAANASQITSRLGGGLHGLLGLVLIATQYALVSAVPFVRLTSPGAFVIPAGPGITNMHRETARDNHKERVRVFNECNAVEKALIKLITQAVPETYI